MHACMMGESSNSSKRMILAMETQSGSATYLPPVCCDPSKSSVERASCIGSIEEIIEKSKSHWSQVSDFDFDNEVAEVSNMELFKTLQGHPTWGSFFQTFGKSEGSCGDLVMGEKFAEGGEAQIYKVQIKWNDPKTQEFCLQNSTDWILKVFKMGTFLRQLQSQWPQGMLQFHADKVSRVELGLPQILRFHCEVCCGTLLEDWRFAFVMIKEKEDLRSLIDHRMLTRSNNERPLSKKEAMGVMYELAFGMNQLHNRGIVHRDIKASNVLVSRTGGCYIADFECSVGIVGTGFWRAPEILEACKHGNVCTKVESYSPKQWIFTVME